MISLAGEVSALGLLLKQAELAGDAGLSLLSGNQVGEASVLCPSPGLAACSFPWTTLWKSPTWRSLVTSLSVIPVGSAELSLVPSQWSLLQKFPARQPRSPESWICSPVVAVARLACALLKRKPWQGGGGENHVA